MKKPLPKTRSTAAKATGPRVRPRIKVWMESENGFGFGSRFINILQAVERTGSIKHAASELGWSYRHVWSRIKEAEKALDCCLVTSKLGGKGTDRSELTEPARQLVARFLDVRARLLALAQQEREFANP